MSLAAPTGMRRAFTLVELMVVIALITIIGAIAYPRLTEGARKLRAREGAKAIVNAVVAARGQAMIRNLAYRVTLESSGQVGAQGPTGGGRVFVERASGSSCTAAGTTFTLLDQPTGGPTTPNNAVFNFWFSTLGDINLCLVRTAVAPEVNAASACNAGTTQLCITPDGSVTNLGDPAAAFTVAYVKENETGSGSPRGIGVVRQIVIPRRKSVQVNPVQVTDAVCL